jgi:hypothetical protein
MSTVLEDQGGRDSWIGISRKAEMKIEEVGSKVRLKKGRVLNLENQSICFESYDLIGSKLIVEILGPFISRQGKWDGGGNSKYQGELPTSL